MFQDMLWEGMAGNEGIRDQESGWHVIYLFEPSRKELERVLRDPCVTKVWISGHSSQGDDGTWHPEIWINPVEFISPRDVKRWRDGRPPIGECVIRACTQEPFREEWRDAFNVPDDGDLWLSPDRDKPWK
jgi:hypothetical protein